MNTADITNKFRVTLDGQLVGDEKCRNTRGGFDNLTARVAQLCGGGPVRIAAIVEDVTTITCNGHTVTLAAV